MAQSLGGVSTTSRLTLFPMQNAASGAVAFYAFDPAQGYNDPIAGGYYSFKIEDVLPGRTPTLAQAVVSYRDLGIVNFSFQLTGSNDAQQVITQTVLVTLGNQKPTGRIMTKIIGLNFPACQNPQLTIMRPVNGGPLSITKLILCGRVEIGQKFS